MYLTVEGYPCVRLLNLSGEIGCASKSIQCHPFFCIHLKIQLPCLLVGVAIIDLTQPRAEAYPGIEDLS